MKKALFFLLMIFNIVLSVQAQIKEITNTILFRIHFQSGFKNDTVSFYINKEEILKNIILSSDLSANAHCEVDIRKTSGLPRMKTKFTRFLYEEIPTARVTTETWYWSRESPPIDKNGDMEFTVIINGKSHYGKVNIKNGKFIGIAKDDEERIGNIEIRQSKKPWNYM